MLKHKDIDVLIKLLPFYEVDLTLKQNEPGAAYSKSRTDAAYLRKLIAITRSDAEMLKRRKGVCTLQGLMNHYFD